MAAGEEFLEERVAFMASIAAAGEPALVVFDLDNTIFDTRPRTLAAARAFDVAAGSAWFAKTDLPDIRRDGRETALAAGLATDVASGFARHWDEFFWCPTSFVHDTPMETVIHWAHRAAGAGARIRYLTGRIAALHDASVAALARVGLLADPEDVVCKPDLSVRTAPWKAEILAGWAESTLIGWFLTEGRRDIAAVQARATAVTCVLLDCSFETGGCAVRPDTPTLARVF
jgi:hypothetical protein